MKRFIPFTINIHRDKENELIIIEMTNTHTNQTKQKLIPFSSSRQEVMIAINQLQDEFIRPRS